jgi:malate/lactate dehydrogenase
MSAANAVAEHMHDWVLGTPAGEWVSMAVVSKGEYGITEGLVFSYPVQCSNGSWRIVPNLPVEDWARGLLKKTEDELVDERRQALGQ